jgi:preprotein translocase subunit SecG
MTFVLDVVQVFLSIMLVFLVLMHSGRDTGLSGFGMGAGGGASPFGSGGGSLVERNLNRWTIGFALLYVINTIVLIKLS